MEWTPFRVIVDIILGGIGVFALYSGFAKKGAMFRKPQVSEDNRPAYNKKLSLFLLISGVGLLVIILLDFINVSDVIRLACYVVVIAWFAYFGFSTRKYMK